MPQPVYNLVHYLGIFLLIVALGGMSIHAANGGTRRTSKTRRLTAILHGVGLFLVLLGGFGMLAKMGIMADLPGWVWAKLVVWVLLGAAVAVPYRKPDLAVPMAVVVPLLALVAAWLALFKPF